jgi:DNA-directed RNA polymerase specialized sigma24 family protein
MSQAEFPTTHATWIAAQLSRGEAGRTEVHDHVMRRYAAPLRAYVLGSTLRTLDDADALVNGFFVSRLSRGDYLGKWQESALPLRRWLVNGLLLHARERMREMRKSAGGCEGCACGTGCESVDAIGLEPSAFESFERAWSRALLGDACSLAQRELVAEGDGDAWEVFRRHYLDGLEYADIGLQLRITAAEARTRARRASYRFERALRKLLEDEGVARDDLDEEIAWLMEVSGR